MSIRVRNIIKTDGNRQELTNASTDGLRAHRDSLIVEDLVMSGLLEQGRYTDDRNMVEYLVSGPHVFCRMRNRDGSWTAHEEALHGEAQVVEHIERGHIHKA